MTVPGLPTLRLDHLLGAGAALFVLLALWPWIVPDAGSMPRPERPATPPPGIAVLPPQATFSATVERPLFSPTRRGVSGGGQTGPAAGIEARYQLVGLVVSEDVRRAWLAEGARHFDVGEGDKLEGWTVHRIEQDRLVLTSPADEAVLHLRRQGEDSAARR